MSIKSINFLKSKKASLMDPILSSAYILKIVVTILICLFIWGSFQTLMTSTIVGSPSETILGTVMTDLHNAYFSIDYVFPFLVGGLMLVSLIFAFKTGANIIWGIVSIIIWAIALLMATVFVNVYLMVSDQFPTIYAAMPIMDVIMTNLHYFVLAWIALICLVMFRKTNVEDEAGEMQRRFYGR